MSRSRLPITCFVLIHVMYDKFFLTGVILCELLVSITYYILLPLKKELFVM
ncbi:hypothetical protein E2C01_033333 [Portunus trituberculatus]|uniref:Uncharacterized protein n=1 Tax=Portunus trituberculatus TaxID=210409 RepID=A0A5B7F595_PORTR|nr:hypothetical protein [Portunus trituberculatus]